MHITSHVRTCPGHVVFPNSGEVPGVIPAAESVRVCNRVHLLACACTLQVFCLSDILGQLMFNNSLKQLGIAPPVSLPAIFVAGMHLAGIKMMLLDISHFWHAW